MGKKLASDGISGNFHIPCEESEITIWKTTEVICAGTVIIYYGDGCADKLEVTVIDSHGRMDSFFVYSKSTQSRTYANLVKVKIKRCGGVGQFPSFGNYCIDLHYFINSKQIKHTKKHKKKHKKNKKNKKKCAN